MESDGAPVLSQVEMSDDKEISMEDQAAKPMTRRCLDFAKAHNVKLEVLCGVTVALAQVPEAVAFALVAGVSPSIGVNSAWIVGLITALFGGRPAMICGATGALAVVVPDLVKEHGPEYLFYAVMLMGLIQIVLGTCRIGNVIKMIPSSVMIGFCNGLALVIGLAQFNSFKVIDNNGGHRRLIPQNESGWQHDRRLSGSFGAFTDGKPWIEGQELYFSVGIALIAFLVSVLMPMLTKKIPSSLTAIVLCTAIEWGIIRGVIGAQTPTVLDASDGGVGGNFPIPVWFDSRYSMPYIGMDLFMKIVSVSIVLAAIGLLESLMTLNLVDDITLTKGNPTRESVAQGFANLVCGALGGMGGCAMIGQSMINIGSGARSRLSSTCAGLFLLVVVLGLAPAINIIPVAALAGVMFNVVYHTFEWSSLRLICVACMPLTVRAKLLSEDNARRKIRRADAVIIVLVTIVTLFTDLAVAVVCGTVLSCMLFAWESAESITVSLGSEERQADGEVTSRVYDVNGVLFFGSTKRFLSLFDVDSDPSKIYITFHAGMISDYSALECLNTLAERYARAGKTVILQRLKPSCLKTMRKAGSLLSSELELQVGDQEELPKARQHHFHIESLGGPSPNHATHEGSGLTNRAGRATADVETGEVDISI